MQCEDCKRTSDLVTLYNSARPQQTMQMCRQCAETFLRHNTAWKIRE